MNTVRLSELTAVEHTLDSGLRVLVVPQPAVHRAVLHCQLSVGSRFESPADNGISHFLEHMLYRGTAELPYEVHIVRFESDEDLDRYSQDEERKRWLHLKNSSVRSALLIKGSSL